MYLQLFGFQEKPFHITPNPRFIFLSNNHNEAFAHLLYGIRQRVGFLSLTGEVGTGKTTVLRTLLGQLEESDYQVALIFNPCLSALELLQTIHKEFAIPLESEQEQLVQLHDSLNRFLLQQREAGKTVVLVIDEAQNLDPSVLEQLRLLSNLETDTEKLIQLILVGQPELDHLLQRDDLRQLRQRLAVRYRLQPMDAEDSCAYIRHRLKVAGWRGGELFSEKALRLAFRYSGGTPRLINLLCDRALLVAYGRDSLVVSAQDVRVAQEELNQLESSAGSYRPLIISTTILLLLVLLGAPSLLTMQTPVAEPWSSVKDSANTADLSSSKIKIDPLPVKAVDQARVEILQNAVASFSTEESTRRALSALFDLWQKERPTEIDSVKSIYTLRNVLASAGFVYFEAQAQFDDLLAMNVPAVLKIIVPGISGKRYFTLSDINDNSVRLEPPLTESGWIDKEELESVWFGKLLLPYVNHQRIGQINRLGQSGKQVVMLQDLMRRLDPTNTPDSGTFDDQTIEAVTRFQTRHRLAPDGRVGNQTLFWIYKDAGLDMPRLAQEEKRELNP